MANLRKIKEYYPLIALMVILFLLLIDCRNYQTLIIFSNVFGFSFMTNNLIKERYKNNLICKNSLFALNFINLVNIIGCFLNYDYYLRVLLIFTILAVLIITVYKQWKYTKKYKNNLKD